MNYIEFLFLSLSIIVLFGILKRLCHFSTISSICLVLTVIPPVFISLESTSQFMTTDEFTISSEILGLSSSHLSQWNAGSNRTSDILIGIPFILIKNLMGIQTIDNNLIGLAKLIHWFLGFLIIVFIYFLLNKHLIPSEQSKIFVYMYFYSMLLLPTDILALKILNYDLFSLLLGALAVILLVIAALKAHAQYALWGIVTAFGAAQEKLIASPVLFAALFVFVYIKIGSHDNLIFLKSLAYAIASVTMVILFSLTSLLALYLVLEQPDNLFVNFNSLSAPLILYLAPFMNLLKGTPFQPFSAILAVSTTVFLIALAATIVVKTRRILLALNTLKPLIVFKSILITQIVFFGVLGVIGVYFIKGFWHPYYSVPVSNYLPNPIKNANIIHFGAASYIEHLCYFISSSYAVFFSAIPTIFLLAIILFVYLLIRHPKSKNFLFVNPFSNMIMLLTITAPLLYAITNTPTGTRYFNLFIFLFILFLTIEISNVLCVLKTKTQIIISSIFCLLILLELLPFRPVIGAFRPVWVQYKQNFNQQQPAGETIPGAWLGWGEEVMLSGKSIQQEILKNTDIPEGIRIHFIYKGAWLTAPDYFSIFPIGINDYYTKNDYYIINRFALIQDFCSFPQKTQPLFTIDFSGFTQAWIYRGDHLLSLNEKIIRN